MKQHETALKQPANAMLEANDENIPFTVKTGQNLQY